MFISSYFPSENISSLNISVKDRMGYSGYAQVSLIPSTDIFNGGEFKALGNFGIIAAGLFVLMVVPILLLKRIRGSKDDYVAQSQYRNVKDLIDSMNKESEDQHIRKWVFEKLSAGEDPEILKRSMEEMGYDSGIVDRVLDGQ